MNQFIGNVNVSAITCRNVTDKRQKAIYKPKGEALEYAQYVLNLYGGCTHRCRYCYNQYRFHGSCENGLKKATLENIRVDLEIIKDDKHPVHLCFVGDLYDLGRMDNSYTREVLKLFRKFDQPFQVLTKGGMKAADDFDLYGSDDRFGVTLTFSTWASLVPVIIPEQTLALIEKTHKFVDYYGVGKWNHDCRTNKINWPEFLDDAEALLKRYGRAYKIKATLAVAHNG